MSDDCNRVEVTDPFDFDKDDLEPKSKPVKYKGKEYILREAGNAAVVAYRNATAKSTRLTDGKLSGFDGLAEAEPLLVSKCLFELNPNGQGGNKEGAVHIEFIKSMPNRFVKPMFDWLEKVSDINERTTPDLLRKQIADLQKQLKELEADDSSPKDGSSSTVGTST